MRPVVGAYLGMPHNAKGKLPALLSQTGVFKDTRSLQPADGLIPYDLAVPFWSDGASKRRWVALPGGKIKFSPVGEWSFPRGTVFVKTFVMAVDETQPEVKRRLETRLLVVDSDDGVYGAVYKWRADESDADLLDSSLSEEIRIKTAGAERQQSWYYPSRKDCLTCHNAKARGVLGVKTRQLNHAFTYPSGVQDNELRAWNHIGLFEPAIDEQELVRLPKLAASNDLERSLEDRARSYLDANCAHCHRPGGTVAYFDARYDTPLDQQGLIDGPILISQGIDKPRVIAAHDLWRSIAFMRVSTNEDIRMPPLARKRIDEQGVALIRAWVTSLPGPPVLDPPTISPAGGTYHTPIDVTLSNSEAEADIRYTLDGSVPGPTDLHYEKPIRLTDSTVLRTRAYKSGFTRSITAQQVFSFAQ